MADQFFAVRWCDSKFVELIIKLASKSLWVKENLVSGISSPIKYLVSKLQSNQNVYQVLLYVNSIEKWSGMKNTGLKMPKGDQNLCLSRMFILLES